MVALIRLVDTAFGSVRTYASVPARSKATVVALKNTSAAAPYDIMNTSQITNVMSSLSIARTKASEAATQNIRGYNARQLVASETVVRHNDTQQRLTTLQHSSVSQNISKLLTGPIGLEKERNHSGLQSLLRNHVEVGAKELARVGVFGGDKARRYELSL